MRPDRQRTGQWLHSTPLRRLTSSCLHQRLSAAHSSHSRPVVVGQQLAENNNERTPDCQNKREKGKIYSRLFHFDNDLKRNYHIFDRMFSFNMILSIILEFLYVLTMRPGEIRTAHKGIHKQIGSELRRNYTALCFCYRRQLRFCVHSLLTASAFNASFLSVPDNRLRSCISLRRLRLKSIRHSQHRFRYAIHHRNSRQSAHFCLCACA